MIMPNKVNMFQSHIIKCEIIPKDCEIVSLMTGLMCKHHSCQDIYFYFALCLTPGARLPVLGPLLWCLRSNT